MLKLKKLTVENCHRVSSKIEVIFEPYNREKDPYITTLTGPSGGGKTSILRCVSTAYKAARLHGASEEKVAEFLKIVNNFEPGSKDLKSRAMTCMVTAALGDKVFEFGFEKPARALGTANHIKYHEGIEKFSSRRLLCIGLQDYGLRSGTVLDNQVLVDNLNRFFCVVVARRRTIGNGIGQPSAC
jgi:energy-coupling factor transporter ATP-binding protein EcfA2